VRLPIDPARDALAVIDVQPTFMAGGALPVPDAAAVVPHVNRLLARFPVAFATQDWHPPGHASFASSHAGASPYDLVAMPYGPQILWPDHAVQGTAEAELHPELDTARLRMILRKGTNPALDSYSAFRENDRRTGTGLEGWLRALGIERVFFCGLATDFCVAWSARDALSLGFKAVVLEDACRGIGLPLAEGGDTMTLERQRIDQGGGLIARSYDLA